jgi:hypothetical protein
MAVRLYSKGLLRQTLWVDDYTMLAAMVCPYSSHDTRN